MRVVVVGATGNVGTSVLTALLDDPAVESVVGIARRIPALELPGVQWRSADIARDDLAPHFRGAAAVVHLAWLIQPTRDLRLLRATNVEGSRRLFEAARAAGVGAVLYASSVGAYAAGPEDDAVDESWPATGISTNEYSRQKADVERILDDFEAQAGEPRVVRVRPGLVFKREAAAEQRRYFGGPFVPGSLLRPRLVPLVPRVTGVRFQAVHADDLGRAFRLALHSGLRGPVNVAAADVLDLTDVARLLGARTVPVPGSAVRAAAALAWRLRLTPITASWLDLARFAPVMDTSRARQELGWSPGRSGREALAELLDGIRAGAGLDTPPLHPAAGGPFRVRELLSGVGRRP